MSTIKTTLKGIGVIGISALGTSINAQVPVDNIKAQTSQNNINVVPNESTINFIDHLGEDLMNIDSTSTRLKGALYPRIKNNEYIDFIISVANERDDTAIFSIPYQDLDQTDIVSIIKELPSSITVGWTINTLKRNNRDPDGWLTFCDPSKVEPEQFKGLFERLNNLKLKFQEMGKENESHIKTVDELLTGAKEIYTTIDTVDQISQITGDSIVMTINNIKFLEWILGYETGIMFSNKTLIINIESTVPKTNFIQGEINYRHNWLNLSAGVEFSETNLDEPTINPTFGTDIIISDAIGIGVTTIFNVTENEPVLLRVDPNIKIFFNRSNGYVELTAMYHNHPEETIHYGLNATHQITRNIAVSVGVMTDDLPNRERELNGKNVKAKLGLSFKI